MSVKYWITLIEWLRIEYYLFSAIKLALIRIYWARKRKFRFINLRLRNSVKLT